MHTPDLERMDATLYKYDTTGVCIERARIYYMPLWRVLEPYFSLKKYRIGSSRNEIMLSTSPTWPLHGVLQCRQKILVLFLLLVTY